MGINKKIIETEATPPLQNFNTVLYTGDGTSNQFIDVGFTPDFVWIKGRNYADYHNTIDSVRTAGCFLNTNATTAEDCGGSLHAQITTGGFDTRLNPNASGRNYVAWCWKAGGTAVTNTNGTITSQVSVNTNIGFSIIKFVGTGATATVGHGLNSTPEIYMMKNLDQAGYKWPTHTQDVGSLSGNYSGALNETGTFNSYTFTSANSTTIGLTSGQPDRNPSGQEMIVYAFHSVAGFSKIGTYTGNGSSTGPTITLGFQPDWLMIKRTDVADEWYLYDSARSTSNPRTKILLPNADISELDNVAYSVDFLSNGFQLKSATSSATNASGGTYIYMAFKIS